METSFIINKTMILTGIVLIPVLIWFLSIPLTKRTLLIGLIFLLIFSRGTLEILGIQITVIRLILEVLIIWVFIKGVFFSKKKNKKFPGVVWLLLFIISSILSVLLNENGFIDIVLFIRDYLIIFLFFYGVLNMRFPKKEQDVLKKLIIYLFAAQIFSNIIKYLVLHDIVEPYIGTMANLGGSLTVIFALMGTTYSLTLYFVLKKKSYLLFSFGFILFGLLGGKRAIIVYFPILYLFISFIYQKYFEKLKIRGINRLFLISLLSTLIFYSSIRLMPSLNKEREVGGSFDMEYALDYSESYVTTGAGAVEEVGRLEAPVYLFNLLLNDNPFNLIFGYGAGHLIKSKYNSKLQNEGSQQDLSTSLYGVGYGARTAFLQILLQVGIIGVIFFLLLIYSIFRYTNSVFKSNIDTKNAKINYLFLLGCWLIFVLDFFTYSVSMVQISSVSIVFYWFLSNKLFIKVMRINIAIPKTDKIPSKYF